MDKTSQNQIELSGNTIQSILMTKFTEVERYDLITMLLLLADSLSPMMYFQKELPEFGEILTMRNKIIS